MCRNSHSQVWNYIFCFAKSTHAPHEIIFIVNAQRSNNSAFLITSIFNYSVLHFHKSEIRSFIQPFLLHCTANKLKCKLKMSGKIWTERRWEEGYKMIEFLQRVAWIQETMKISKRCRIPCTCKRWSISKKKRELFALRKCKKRLVRTHQNHFIL